MATPGVEDRRRLGRHGRNAVPRSSDAARARLRTDAASGPHRLRDLRHAVAGARQRDSGLPCAERRCARGRLRDDAAAGEHEGRLRRRGSRRQRRPRPRLVGRHDRPRQGVRHRSVLRRQHEPARRLPRHDGTLVDEPGDRPAVRIGLSGDHRRRHGARRARVPRRARDHAAGRRRRRIARRHAGARVGGAVPRSRSTRSWSIASTHALQPQGVAWNAIARNAITADPDWQGGHYYGTGRAPNAGMGVARMVGHITYLSATSLDDKFGRRLQFARRHPLHADRARVRGRELPAPPGGHLRQALRRQHLPLHVAGADLLRPRPAVRRRHAWRDALRNVSRENAAHRVQLRLAVSAVGLRGARGGASRAAARTSSST